VLSTSTIIPAPAATVATIAPAHRAIGVQPLRALRHE
jgi:ABC-type lipoprotein release transport system permease subunit